MDNLLCGTCGSADTFSDHVKANVYAVECNTCGARRLTERDYGDAIESMEFAFAGER